MAIANIACPKCSQTFRSSDDVKGTRISCPLCGAGFVVKEFAASEGPRLAKPKTTAPTSDDEDEANPYGVTNVQIKARCPNCANEMQSEDAIICVHCGYNTQTRLLGKTERVIAQTKSDSLRWLMPGIGCFLGILALVFVQHYFVLSIAAGGAESGILSILFSEPVFIWITIIFLGIIWRLGAFSFKRLIVEPIPPEEEAE